MKQPIAASWLKENRRRHRLTQAEVASHTGLTVRDIQRMEDGALNLPLRKFMAIADFFDADLSEMLFGEVE